MEKTTCIILDENEKDRLDLTEVLKQFDFLQVIANIGNAKDGLVLINDLEPNLLFLGFKADDSNTFKFLEKIKKQPTIVFSTNNNADIEIFETANLLYLKKPYSLNAVQQLLNDFRKTHQQLAQKMQGLLGKLKFD